MKLVKYGFENMDTGLMDDGGCCLELSACGDTLDEMLEDAHIWRIGNNGGECGDYALQDMGGGSDYNDCVEMIKNHILKRDQVIAMEKIGLAV